MANRSWAEARRVLAVRLDGLGDVLMTTPAIRALGESLGAEVTLLASPAGAAIAAMVPEIAGVVPYEAPWMKHSALEDAARDLAMIEELRRRQFDAAVIFTVCTQSPLPAAMLCHLAGIPLRLAHCRENPYGLLSDRVAEPEASPGARHEVRRQLDLVATVGARASDERLSLRPPPAARRSALAKARAAGLDGQGPWVLVHPGATAESRRYPAEAYGSVVAALRERSLQVVVTGDCSERQLAGAVAAGRAVVLAGELGLAELCGLIEAAPLVVTNNTGPAHIAAAVGTPVVDLYALTNLQHTPWMAASRVLSREVPCRNCLKSVCPEGHHLCLRGVAPERVVEAALELLAEGGMAGPARPGGRRLPK